MYRRLVLLTWGFTVAAAAASAQTPPPPDGPRAVGGQDGFAIESASGDFRLQIGTLIHADGRFALDDESAEVVDSFGLRRVRPYLRGRVARTFEFYLNPDFAGGTLVLQDAFADAIVSPAFRLRVGKAKTPFGMERLHSASNLLFIERALPTSLVPNRDVGVQALGELAGQVRYFAGVANGVTDGASADADTNDGKDVFGRVAWRPFRASGGSRLHGLGFALSASSGEAAGLPTLRTATLQQPYFSYAAGAVADGTRTRVSPQLWYFHKVFGGWAEYVRSETPVRRGSTRAEVAHRAWQVAVSWMLTGEHATDASAGVRPRDNFDPGTGHVGAIQLAARFHALDVDEAATASGLAAPGSSPAARAWTLGVRWYLTGNFSYTLNFERTVFDGHNSSRRPENALALRTQISF